MNSPGSARARGRVRVPIAHAFLLAEASPAAPTIAVLLICLALVVSIASAQVGEGGAHRLAGKVELARLLDLSAEQLGLKIEYDPNALKGVTVTLRIREPISDDELWAVTNQLLAARGFAAVQMPGSDIISVTRISDAQRLARLEAEPRRADAGYVTVLVELKHRTPRDVSEAIQPLLSKPGGSIAPLAHTDLVLISDYRPRVEQALELIERLDVPLTAAAIETIPVENVAAIPLSGLVNAAATTFGRVGGVPLQGKVVAASDGNAIIVIAHPDELVHWRALAQRFDQRQAVQRRTYIPEHFPAQDVGRLIEQTVRDPGPRGSRDQWRLVTDELTGSLIVTATPAEHEQIAALVERLDSAPREVRRPVRAFPIRNRSVHEIVEVLTRLIEAGALESAEALPARPEPMTPPARQRTQRQVLPRGAEPILPTTVERSTIATGRQRPVAVVGESTSLTLTADEGTNTLIAIGDARRLAQLEELIRTLDVRQPQVMLEVLVVSLTDTDTFDLGIELEKLEVSGSTLISLSSLFGLGTAGLAEAPSPTGAGGTALVLSPGDFRILVRALETINDGRSLNVPKILVNNNQPATLDSVLQVPFVSTNASQTVATTSFGGTQDAGTSVTVTPQIAEGDHLVLEYSVSLSAFVGESSDPTIPPPRQQNNLTSIVTIPDGYTVVVGGLETVSEAEAVSQIPFLGSIPLIGELFKNRSISSSRSRFYVFIRADILRHTGFEDLKYLSDRHGAEMGVDDGWPQVEPRVIR